MLIRVLELVEFESVAAHRWKFVGALRDLITLTFVSLEDSFK